MGSLGPPEGTVIGRVLPKEVAAVAGMEGLRTHPQRQLRRGHIVELHVILVAALEPAVDHRVHIHGESVLVALPHQDRWVVAPALLVSLAGQDVEDLVGLDPLLAEPAIVEAHTRLDETVVWKEGLHTTTLPQNTTQ